jgi:hypothetical protein
LNGNICPTDAGANRFFCPVLMLQVRYGFNPSVPSVITRSMCVNARAVPRLRGVPHWQGCLPFLALLALCLHPLFHHRCDVVDQAIMCFRVREFVAKLLQPHCSASIQSNSHYYCVATVILGFSVFAVNVIGHFSQNELLIYVSELLQFGMCISLLLLFVLVHIYMTRTSVCDAAASSFRKRRRLVHTAFAFVEITLLMRTIFWLYIAAALHNATAVQRPSPLFSPSTSSQHFFFCNTRAL